MHDSFLSDKKYDQHPFRGEIKKNYLICSTGRCGSTLLCTLLIDSQVMGIPHEYFNFDDHAMPLIRRFGVSTTPTILLDEYVEKVTRYRTTKNGVFGFKAHINQAALLINNNLLYKYFPGIKFIHVTRNDVIRQAVSYSIAAQTNKWSSHGVAKNKPIYNREEIQSKLKIIQEQNMEWQRIFGIYKVKPLKVAYEDLIKDTHAVCEKICRFVGIQTDYNFDLNNAHMSKQSGAINESWIFKYKIEKTIQP